MSATARRRLPLVAALLGVAVLGTILGVLGRNPDIPLDARSGFPGGARGLHDALVRLGWRVERRTFPLPAAAADSTVTYVTLRGGMDDGDAARLLAATRAGAGLVLVAEPGDPLSDTLRLVDPGPEFLALDNARTARELGLRDAVRAPGCVRRSTDAQRGTQFVQRALRDSNEMRVPARRTLVTAQRDTHVVAAVAGIPLGRGRLVAYADGAMLRNDALRACWSVAGPVAVTAVAWASGGAVGGGRRVVFLDGRDPNAPRAAAPSTLRAIRRALVEVPAGRTLAQGLLAALVLLLAVAPRALAPLPAHPPQRRSSLEHVGALARAYREARATRLATRRLVRGLRRRYGGAIAVRGAAPAADDDARFLDAAATRHAPRAADARQIAAALASPVSAPDLVAVGAAVARLDRALDAARRGLEPPPE